MDDGRMTTPKRHVWMVVCEDGAPALRHSGACDEPTAYFTKVEALAATQKTHCRSGACRGRLHHRVVRYVDGIVGRQGLRSRT